MSSTSLSCGTPKTNCECLEDPLTRRIKKTLLRIKHEQCCKCIPMIPVRPALQEQKQKQPTMSPMPVLMGMCVPECQCKEDKEEKVKIDIETLERIIWGNPEEEEEEEECYPPEVLCAMKPAYEDGTPINPEEYHKFSIEDLMPNCFCCRRYGLQNECEKHCRLYPPYLTMGEIAVAATKYYDSSFDLVDMNDWCGHIEKMTLRDIDKELKTAKKCFARNYKRSYGCSLRNCPQKCL